jgi:hypothetical protein
MFAHRVANVTDDERKAQGIWQTFENSLRYLAMLFLAEYAAFPESDETVNQLMDKLRRPTTGEFVLLIREGVKRLDRNGHEWFVTEFPAFFKNVHGSTRSAKRLGHQHSVDSLLALRNRLAHGGYEADWTKLANDYYPLLLEFLDHCAFLTDYSLCRFLGLANEGWWSVAELTGHREPATERTFEALTKLQPTTSDVFLANTRNNQILPLAPFAMVHPCADCAQRAGANGPGEEIFLLNGAEADETSFIGVRHLLRLADTSFLAFRERKRVSLRKTSTQDISQQILKDNAARATELFLRAQIRQGLYLPEIYIPRATLEHELDNFLSGNSTAFLLLGQSGIGKTNVLCNWATRIAANNVSVLLLSGATLDASALEDSLLSSLGLSGSFGSLVEMLDTRNLGTLVIVVDDLNQHAHVSLILRQLHQLVCRYAGRKLKVVFSLRTSHFRQILDGLVDTRLDPEGNSFFSPTVFYTTLVDGAGGTRTTYQQILTKIDSNNPELELMYEAYRKLRTPAGSERLRQFCPLTLFSDLSRNVRDLISNPWYMRLVMELYDQREIPTRIFSTDLLREYCQRLIFSREDTADLAQKLIDLMCEQESISLVRSALESDPALKSAMIDSAYEPSPYNRLLDDRVLVEVPELITKGLFVTTRYRVQFAFDTVMEFLIANHCLSMGTPNAEVIQMLLTGSQTFLPFAGAVQAIWCIQAQQDNGDLILDCIQRCDGSAVKPLIPTLRQLEAHGHSSYNRVLDYLSHDSELKSGIILSILGSGMGAENGIDAQNVVFKRLFDWQGKEGPALKFCAGKYLIFGYALSQQDAQAVNIYNELQRLYSTSAATPPDFLVFERELTPQQRERMYEFAWFAEAYGAQLLTTMTGKTSLIDEILSRLKLEWLPDHIKVRLMSLIQFVAQFRAVSTTEAAMQAAEEIYVAEKDRNFQKGIKAFDKVGLDLAALTAEQMPHAIQEVERELGFLYDAYKVLFAQAEDERQIIAGLILLYIEDRSAPAAYLPGKVANAQAVVSCNLILAQAYARANDEEKTIEYLLRAEEYECARGASNLLLQIYDFLFDAAKKYGALETAQKYADLYLDCDCYLALPPQLHQTLSSADLFPLVVNYLNLQPDEVNEAQTKMKQIWKNLLRQRCYAWLTLDEMETVRELSEKGGDWEGYLRAKVVSYDELRREQRILTVIRVLDLFRPGNRETQQQSFRDRITDHLRLMTGSLVQPSTVPAGDPATPQFDPVEYEIVLEHLRNHWPVSSEDDRLMGVAGAAVFPAFVPLLHLEDDPAMCAAVDKELGSYKAIRWLSSLIRCWCADISKGRRGSQFLQQKVNSEKNVTFSLDDSPELVLITLALLVFWDRLKVQLAPATMQTLKESSTSADNLELMIETIRTNVPAAPDLAREIVSEFKRELCEVHKSLLAQFDA